MSRPVVRPITAEARQGVEPIDLREWVRAYVARILELERVAAPDREAA